MMTYLLWVAGVPVMEFYGEGAGATCGHVATAVAFTYHAAASCVLLVAA